MKYKLKLVDSGVVAAAHKQWNKQLNDIGEENVPQHGYNIFLGYVENEISTNKNPNHHFYALTDGNHIEAIFQLSVALPKQPKSWLKVLSVRTAPRNDTRAPDTKKSPFIERKNRITELYTQVIIETIEFSNGQYPAKMVKIYGNKQADSNFFAHFVTATANHKDALKSLGYDINRHGNWLQIDKKSRLRKVQ